MAKIAVKNDWDYFDPFGINEYFGAGGAGAGGAGAGGTSAAGSLGALGAALAAAILNYKGNEKNKELYLPGEKSKTDTAQSEAKKDAVITPGIPTDFEQIGKQELPYLPNAGLIGQTEAKKDKVITPGIPTDFEQIGKQELPYLPNAKTEAAEKEGILPTIPPINEGLPGTEIKDETNTNLESEISPGFDMQSMYDFIMQQQQRQWEREDAIREQTRYDQQHAYEYAVADMRRAGINPNLVGVNPAQSGGGITQATGLDYSPWTAEINKQLALMEQEIQNSFQGDENAKDRFTKGLTSLLQLFTMFALKG